MKIEVDTITDSVDELKEAVELIQEALERRTGVTGEKVRAPLRPSEFKKEQPKVIFEDIMSTAPLKKTIQAPQTPSKTKEELPKKRKVLKQDERAPEEEEEDEDRKLPQIQYRDYW